MIEPKIKDDVIRLLYNSKGTAEIAKTPAVEQKYVVAAIREIENSFPGGFSEHKGYGDDAIGVSLHPRYKEQMHVFVEQGGFEAQHKQKLEREQKEEYQVLESAERSAREAKSSRIAAWVAAARSRIKAFCNPRAQ